MRSRFISQDLLDGFTHRPFPASGGGHDVYAIGDGPDVIVMHELPGLTRDCVDFARRLAREAFRVHLPLLFGEPGDNKALTHWRALCVSQEFARLEAGVSAPITDWLRQLARDLAPLDSGIRIGAIGMCLTGAFVIPMIIEPGVHAGVISQPAIPFSLLYRAVGLGGVRWMRQLNVSDNDLDKAAVCARAAGKAVLVQRMQGDRLSPAARQKRIVEAFGAQAEHATYDDGAWLRRLIDPPHALLTEEYAEHRDDTGHVTRRAFAKVVDFLRQHLATGAGATA